MGVICNYGFVTCFQAIRELKGATELASIPVMLVGNKCDESEAREVTTAEGEQEAQKWGCHFMETSAKTNHNVKELFQELLNLEKNRNISLQLEKISHLKGMKKIKEKCSLM